MDAADVERIVRAEIDGFTYEPPAPGSTLGTPWSEEKVMSYIPKLRAALVTPYRRQFEVRDTYEQMRATEPTLAEYWVVAETESYIQFFDPESGEFGLACWSEDGKRLGTIGVGGDLVGVFTAM